MNIRKIIKDIKNIKKEDKKLIIKLIIIILMFLIVITSFNSGKKFYYLKSTFLENKKVECKGEIARWNFDVRIKTQDEEVRYEKNL